MNAENSFIGGGEMGKVVRAKDWSQTPLGPIESWPPSLRTAASLVLNSNFPIALAWGPHHVQLYNDGYWPICGVKHPAAMGQDFSECWASAWPVIGGAFESALAGTTAFLEDQRMFLDRLGYLEETFFTFSFSPIRDERGAVAGLFHPVTETTGKMVGQRRTRTLRDLTAIGLEAQSLDEALLRSAQILGEAAFDVPFALFYRLDEDRRTARLVAQTGLPPGGAASPVVVDLTREDAGWPLALVATTGATVTVNDVRARFPELVCAPYPEPIAAARVQPITMPGHERTPCLMVIGMSTRLPMNESYVTFHELLGTTVGNVVASALAVEAERRRAEALAEIDRAKTAFFANISHEFRTPLTLMLGPLEDELAERTAPLPAPRRERLATAHRNSLRLLKLVNTLLDFSRIEAGRAQANYQPTDLAALTAELAGMFRSATESAGLTLTVDCPALPEPVFVDRDMWEKVVLNLISNAFKHTFTGGIRVALRWCGDHVELDVADSGVGIPAADLPRLFERFHQVKGARSRTHEGTGIGLALVQELIHLHGGTVRAESAEGKGSTFIATLKTGHGHLPAGKIATTPAPLAPATRATAYVEEALQWLPTATPADAIVAADTDRARIVWADDNADMRDYVRRLLGEHYAVTAVSNGAEAVAVSIANPPDLVLTDIMMPGLDGFGVLRELRANDRTRHVPVILLSARAGEEAAVGGLEMGADDYLAKPFAARELLARVRTHLELAKLRREWATGQERTAELARSEAESHRLNAELEQRVINRTAELEAANKELEAFSYSVSHDLRAPLRAVNGFAGMVLEDFSSQLPEEGRRHLERIREGGQRMGELIDDLLAFSRLGRQSVNRQSVDTAKLVQNVLDESKPQRNGHQVEIKIGKLPPCTGDPALLKQIWVNLISNAVKYSRGREPATVEIGCERQGGENVFFVCDNGAGFDMQYSNKLFGVFQRLHRADEFEGTGVGLAIVQRIVHRHGGRVWAEAEVDRGATFHFTLEGENKP